MSDNCCKVLNPAEWDQKELVWRDKPFYKSRYFAFLHVPVNIGTKIAEGTGKIEEMGLTAEPMVLLKNITLWGADILIPIKNKTDVFEIEIITGRFFTRLFEGHYAEGRRWIRETRNWCRAKGFEVEEFIFWYATCPKCAKKRGDKTQVVVFAKVE